MVIKIVTQSELIEKDEIDVVIDRIAKTREKIVEVHGSKSHKGGYRMINCVFCGGIVTFSGPAFNGHIGAACENGCVRWQE